MSLLPVQNKKNEFAPALNGAQSMKSGIKPRDYFEMLSLICSGYGLSGK